MKTIIIKNALPAIMANAVVAEFPSQEWRYWHRYNDENSIKYASKDPLRFPNAIARALNHLGSVIETSGISIHYPHTFVDYEFHAAGMHMIPSGGYLSKHKDAARHPLLPWKRTLSACWYATQGWQEDWGGQIDIEGAVMVPEFNTLAIFESDRLHEVLPITGSEDRRVLSLFCWEVDHEAAGETQAAFS